MMKATIVNYTDSDLCITDGSGKNLRTFPRSGPKATASQTERTLGAVDGVSVVMVSYGMPVNLPAPEAGVFIVISWDVLEAAKMAGRPVDDLLVPADPVRDPDGTIIGYQQFAAVSQGRFPGG